MSHTHGYPIELFDMYVKDVMPSHRNLSTGATLCILAPILFGVFLLAAAVMPDFSFFAECQNIPGGDICTITVQ